MTQALSRTSAGSAVSAPADKTERMMEIMPFGTKNAIKLSVSQVQNYLCEPTREGRRCSERDARRFIMMCAAKGLNPWDGDAFLVGYDTNMNGTRVAKFQQITSIAALLKRAELHPEYAGLDSGIIIRPGLVCNACEQTGVVKDGSGVKSACPICGGRGEIDEIQGDIMPEGDTALIGGWATVYYKPTAPGVEPKRPVHKRLSIKAYAKESPVWNQNPEGMIAKCAEADALRTAFPTHMGGMYLRHEFDLPASSVTVSPADMPNMLVETTSHAEPTSGQPAGGPGEQKQPEGTEPAASTAPNVQNAPPTGAPPAGRRQAQPKPGEPSARAQLAEILTREGFTFSHLQKWGMDTGNIGGADSMGSFEEVPEADAKRLLRSTAGLLRALADIKAREEQHAEQVKNQTPPQQTPPQQ